MATEVEGQEVETQQVTEDPPDEQLLEFAEALDIDSEDYETGKDLEAACYLAAIKQTNELKNRPVSRATDSDKEPAARSQEPEKLAIEAYKVALKSEDFDEKLINELNHLSKTQSERFTGALEKLLKTQSDQMKDVRKELEHVTAIARQATRNDDMSAFERWIGRNEDVCEWLGEGDTEDLEDDKFSRRRDKVLNKAYEIHAKARENGKATLSRSKLFAKALKSVRPIKVTRTARAGGASADSTVNGKPVSEKDRMANAVKAADAGLAKLHRS